jgi:hypothetical protein
VHNYGTNSITSFTAELFETGNPTPIDVNNWTGNLAASGNTTVQFNPLISVVSAANYEVVVSNPNGNIDIYPTYNEGDFNIEVAGATTENSITFSITTDTWPEETSWTIYGGGALLASGGPYTNQPEATFTEDVTLSIDDCYEVIINDTYGDGLVGNAGYSVTDAAGLVLFQEVGPAFGFQVIEPFAKSSVATAITNQSNISLNIYPNPAQDLLTIDGTYTAVDIFDVFGKLVLSSEYAENINVSSLADGIYMLNITTEKGIKTQKITITK